MDRSLKGAHTTTTIRGRGRGQYSVPPLVACVNLIFGKSSWHVILAYGCCCPPLSPIGLWLEQRKNERRESETFRLVFRGKLSSGWLWAWLSTRFWEIVAFSCSWKRVYVLIAFDTLRKHMDFFALPLGSRITGGGGDSLLYSRTRSSRSSAGI